MRESRVAGALLWLVLAAVPAWAVEIPYRLADINRTPGDPSSVRLPEEPAGFFELGGRLLFSTVGSDNADGGILWSTDGTAQGTVQLSSSICPVPCHNIVPLKVWNGIALLRIGVGDAESSLFFRLARTDGTPAGTYLLADSLEADPVFGPPDFFYFERCKEDYSSCAIWRSDGTRAGTRAVPAANHIPFYYIRQSFVSWQGKLCFFAFQQPSDFEPSDFALWCSDGTTPGTIRLAGIQEAPDDSEARLVATPSHLFFTSGETEEDLWVTDGTPESSRRLADFEPGACTSQPHYCEVADVDSITADGDAVHFETHRTGHGTEIWRSDGTEGGTGPIAELPPGVLTTQPPHRVGDRWVFPAAVSGQPVVLWTAGEGFAQAAPLTACAGGDCPVFQTFFTDSPTGPQLFAGEDAAHGLELWITDGTGFGTRRLSDACPGSCPGLRFIYPISTRLGISQGRTWFRAYPSAEALDETGDELWVTDGTPGGTHRVMGHVEGYDIGFLGGLAYFGTGNLERPASELWSTDGSAAHRVAVLRRFAPGSAPVFQALPDGVLLHPYEPDQPSRLWKSDGTPEGTVPLDGFPPDVSRSFVRFLPPVGPLQFFEVSHQSSGPEGRLSSEIWRSDGSSPGTRRIAALDREASIGPAIAWAGKLLFIVTNPEGCSLWSSDGTAPGTGRILRPLPGLRCPTALVDLGSRFLFIARVKAGRHFVPQVFVSDGTPAGTRQISALQEPREPFYDDRPVQVDGTVFFRLAGPFDSEPELWQTDGASRTRRVSFLTAVADLYAFRGSLYFTALLSENGRGLFRVSPGGGPPVLLAQISPFLEGAFYSLPAQFSPAGDRLLFTGKDLEHGAELWSTDGTPAGTQPLQDLQPGPGSSEPQGLVSAGDRAFFSADDGTHGRELWESDGTAEGTRLVADLAPGGFSALLYDSHIAVANGFVFFSADDGRTGLEPWALRLER
jgi:ELWxxDGT repeat protein